MSGAGNGADDVRRFLRSELAVGFVDLVGFTARARTLDDEDLAGLITKFEITVDEAVLAHGGRVVKTMGDGAMFAAPAPLTATRIGLCLTEVAGGDDVLPDVRVGIACGYVLDRRDDVFGPVVNLASRIAGIARPGTVLVAEEVKDGLAHDLAVRDVGVRYLEGIGDVRLWAARRPAAGGPARLDLLAALARGEIDVDRALVLLDA